MALSERVAVARVVKPHGVRGALKVLAFDSGSTVLLEVDKVWLGVSATRPHTVLDCQPAQAGFVLVLEGVADRDAAEAQRGVLLWVSRHDLSLGEGEYLIADLVGCTAVDVAGVLLGTVSEVLPMPAQDVIVLRSPGGGERMVPLVDAFVREVDLDGRRLVLDPPHED
jgi:16S rRNA processing protein RimM